MSAYTQPVSLSGLSYSCDSTKGLSKRTTKLDAMSWAEFDKCMRAGLTYDQVNAIHPMSRTEYDKRVAAGGYQQEHIRKHSQKVKAICEMYDKGASIEDIAKANEISLLYCRSILNDNKRPCNRFALIIRDHKDKIQKMAENNYTVKAMAKELGISPNFMSDILAALDIKTQKERIAEFADDLTRSKLTALLEKYGNIRGVSQATGVSMAKLRECAKILKVAVK